jgi:hypothetical protein
MNKYEYEKLTPFKWFVLENFPFIEADFDSITNYQLYSKVIEYLNKTIDTTNTLGETVENYTNAFIELKTYVDNYFENLDVQEEINNKLDQMVEDGTLENLLMNFTNQLKIYNNYESLINDKNNLVNNQKVKILGYYEINDGGETEFYVTNNPKENNNINLENGLYLERIIKNCKISIEQFGCIGNNSEIDNTTNLQNAINFAQLNNIILYIPNKTFRVLNTLYLQGSLNMKGDSNSNYKNTSTIICNFADNDIPLFAETGSNSVPRCTFENIRFARTRTANDGYPSNPLAFGKKGKCFGFLLNESVFNRCVFVGFGNVIVRAGITSFIECDFTYCNNIVKTSNNINSLQFIACNMYANGTLFDVDGTITNLNLDNSWVEDFVTLLENHYKTISNFNITNSCLTNTVNGEALIKYNDANRPSFSRQHINFLNSTIYSKLNICDIKPSSIECYVDFSNCDVFYGGSGETINITGNGFFHTLSGGNRESLINYGIDTKHNNAYNGINFQPKSLTGANKFFLTQQKYLGYRDTQQNLMCMLPVYIVAQPTDRIQNADLPRYFIYNNSVTSSGEVILKYVDTVLNKVINVITFP